jgi:hypothetical protein
MKKISGLLMGVACWMNVLVVCATEKFEVLPDLPEALSSGGRISVPEVRLSLPRMLDYTQSK